ncbi:hypothetical protein ALC56_02869 [Trachymyrmex septentrionalis]|uniref:DNA-directed DNA polymerase n=1 Tax=Trachymyrmex septentrionalis TaxID=34720 RepID=A0A151K077_9HYME|nr:hypothetical protein ALC56_02869 [Trachymyrmex septentrionalis]
MGAVVNMDYIEPQFLEDAREIVLEYYMRCSYDDALSSYHFHREDCIVWFTRQLNDLAYRVKNLVSANVPVETLSKQQWEAYRSATLTWNAMLKHTSVKFELLTDIDMIMFIERGIRGGLSQYSGRYAQANNKYMHLYDPSESSSYLMYYDVNNLYGWAMCQLLPYAKFRWVEDAANLDASAIALDLPTGYILEVDLEYSQHLHNRHTDLSFCPTRDKPPGITRFDTSDYSTDNAYGMPLANKKVSKIALSPYDDKRNVVSNSTETLPWGH